MRRIKLSQGKYAIVDDEDYEYLNHCKWHIIKTGKEKRYLYAARWVVGTNSPRILIRMHHCIIGKPPKGMVVDHINHNTLDNRKENLRIVSIRQNAQNRRKKGTSRYPGIYKQSNKWIAHINLGSFTSEEAAAEAYEKACKKLFGEDVKG